MQQLQAKALQQVNLSSFSPEATVIIAPPKPEGDGWQAMPLTTGIVSKSYSRSETYIVNGVVVAHNAEQWDKGVKSFAVLYWLRVQGNNIEKVKLPADKLKQALDKISK